MGFEVFPERCDRGAISYLEWERVPKIQGIVTERIGEKFDCFIKLTVESEGVKELEFRGTLPCIPGKGVGIN